MARDTSDAKNAQLVVLRGAQEMAASTSLSDLVIRREGADASERFTRGFPDFDPEWTRGLIEHLRQSGAQVIEDQADATCQLIRFQGPRRDRLALRIYPNRTLQVDGVHGELLTWALDFLREVMPLDRILAQQVEIYRLPVSIAEIKSLFASRAPTADHVLAPEILVQLTSAVALCKIDMPLQDYSALAFPALRGLEGFCFQVLGKECGFQPSMRHRLGEYFESSNARFVLRSIYASDASVVQQFVLNRCYHLWHNMRHRLFHMGGLLEHTVVIDDREAAIDLVNEVLSTIDDSCQRLLKGKK
ncbi:hypothetical protein CDL60_11885 [Roseateles noduli]|nr:hypothetical protein CDL60_11885 [Roseateles noduli]